MAERNLEMSSGKKALVLYEQNMTKNCQLMYSPNLAGDGGVPGHGLGWHLKLRVRPAISSTAMLTLHSLNQQPEESWKINRHCSHPPVLKFCPMLLFSRQANNAFCWWEGSSRLVARRLFGHTPSNSLMGQRKAKFHGVGLHSMHQLVERQVKSMQKVCVSDLFLVKKRQ